MDASADVVRSPEGERTPEGAEPGSLLWARQHIEEVKAGLRDDPGRAYSVQFTAAAEMLRRHHPTAREAVHLAQVAVNWRSS